jgi:hypothetical protein
MSSFFSSSSRPRRSNDGTPYTCPDCGQGLPREFWPAYGPAPIPVHCDGSRVAYQSRRIEMPHHGRRRYAPCWRCGESLGCDQCAGSITEVLCTRCCAWGTPDALAHHGPINDSPTARAKRGGTPAPGVADYPAAFRAAYSRAEPVPVVPPAPPIKPVPTPRTHTPAELRAQATEIADDDIPF